MNPARPEPASTPPPEDGREEAFVAELTAQQAAIQAFIASLMPGDSGTDEVM